MYVLVNITNASKCMLKENIEFYRKLNYSKQNSALLWNCIQFIVIMTLDFRRDR